MGTAIGKISSQYQRYNAWREEQKDKKLYQFGNLCYELLLTILTVLPMIWQTCSMIPLSYEVNDDSAMSQILSGAYTGTPDAHAVFIRYPLSLLIKLLYQWDYSITLFGKSYEHINWYIVTFVAMEIFAMLAVVFRLLHYFQRNRLLLCAVFSLGFLKVWLPCFTRMTFSTVGAFMGCMALLFFAFETEEESYRPWNILILCILLICAYSLRKQCLYMVLPFFALEFVRKYHIQILRKAAPWIVLSICGVCILGCSVLHSKMYGSQEWKQFAIYNHARAYLQDYGGFSDYKDHEEFFKEKGISEAEYNCIKYYRYCFLDQYSPALIEDLYTEVKSGEEQKSMVQKLVDSKKRVKDYILKKEQSNGNLKYASLFVWLFLLPTVLLTMICQRKKGVWEQASLFIEFCGTGVFLLALWFYLAMQGRFPLRVEETIRLVMLTTGLMMICHYLKLWKDAGLIRIHPVFQIIFLAVLLLLCSPWRDLHQLKESQESFLNLQSDKAEVIDWCGNRPENIYITDTNGLVTPIRPYDQYSNKNWYVSGSWIAYSPLFQEKLALNNLKSLASETLVQDNVYIIIRQKDKPERILGADEEKEIKTHLVDTICTQTNNYYSVYHVDSYVYKQDDKNTKKSKQ